MDQLTYDHAANRRRKRRRALVAILLSASLATFGAGAMSLAVFTDTQDVDGDWSTGNDHRSASTPASRSPPTTSSRATTATKTITVSNDGTGDLRYSLSTNATDDGSHLADQIDLTVREGACPSAGAVVYSGKLADAAWGDIAQGVQDDERDVARGPRTRSCASPGRSRSRRTTRTRTAPRR